MKGHEQLEHTDCLKCHEPAGGVPNNKCTDCHTQIGEQIIKKSSFHGLAKAPSHVSNVIKTIKVELRFSPIDEKKFDHSETGFLLDGAHKKSHVAIVIPTSEVLKVNRPGDTRYFGTSPTCIS